MFKVVISDPKGKSYQKEIPDNEEKNFYGLKIGQTFRGEIMGLTGYEFKITGGTDKDGFPMRSDIHTGTRKRILVANGPGFRPTRDGLRRRKTIRGNTISNEIMQINTIVIKSGNKSLEDIFNPAEEPKEEAQE